MPAAVGGSSSSKVESLARQLDSLSSREKAALAEIVTGKPAADIEEAGLTLERGRGSVSSASASPYPRTPQEQQAHHGKLQAVQRARQQAAVAARARAVLPPAGLGFGEDQLPTLVVNGRDVTL